MKKIFFILVLLTILLLTSCSESGYNIYGYQFFDTFDTVISINGYAKNQNQFDEYIEYARERFRYFHKLYDKFNSYDELVNIKTINDNAGIKAVKVEKELFDLLSMAKEWYYKTDGAVNIAYGSVISLYQDYKIIYDLTGEERIPSLQELEKAASLTDIESIILDEQNLTVFINTAGVSIDVGAIAKGYATEIIGNELYDMGFKSFVLSSGGNTKIFDAPLSEDETAWRLNLKDPLLSDGEYEYSITANNTSVVTSGDYLRYYMVGEDKIHHIIDPATNYPTNTYTSVTVLCENAAVADIISTALFILDYEKGRELAEELNVEVLWQFTNGVVKNTENMKNFIKEE